MERMQEVKTRVKLKVGIALIRVNQYYKKHKLEEQLR